MLIDHAFAVNGPLANADAGVEAREAVETLLLLGADPILRLDPDSGRPAPSAVTGAGDNCLVRVRVEVWFAVAEAGFERPRPRMPAQENAGLGKADDLGP